MEDQKETVLCFRTAGDWTGDDVIKLISSINQMYDVFYSYRIVRGLLREQEKEYMRNLERSEMYFRKYLDYPMYEEFYHMWRRMLKDSRKYGRANPFMMSGFPFQQLLSATPTEAQIPLPSSIYEERNLYQSEKEKLIIDRIHISSPGGFSFTGIGEIVQQLREFVKDVWFRNNQEKTMGELEIIEKYLKIQRDNSNSNMPPITAVTVDRKMLGELKKSISQIRSLEQEKKLLPVGEHVDDRPK